MQQAEGTTKLVLRHGGANECVTSSELYTVLMHKHTHGSWDTGHHAEACWLYFESNGEQACEKRVTWRFSFRKSSLVTLWRLSRTGNKPGGRQVLGRSLHGSKRGELSIGYLLFIGASGPALLSPLCAPLCLGRSEVLGPP